MAMQKAIFRALMRFLPSTQGWPRVDIEIESQYKKRTQSQSPLSGLFVISRNSSFVYKDRPSNLQNVARELGEPLPLIHCLRAHGEILQAIGEADQALRPLAGR